MEQKSNFYYARLAKRFFMPTISEFFNPLGVLKGKLPSKALSLVMEWAQIHQQQIMKDWEYAAENKKLQKIPPLE